MLGVILMNKKEAVAYAQLTLDYMLSSKYNGKLTPAALGIEMNQAFKLYDKDVAVIMAHSIVETERGRIAR